LPKLGFHFSISANFSQAGDACPLTKDLPQVTVDELRRKVDDLIIDLEAKPKSVTLEGYDREYHLTAGIVTGSLPSNPISSTFIPTSIFVVLPLFHLSPTNISHGT